jgi:hypothetical protein
MDYRGDSSTLSLVEDNQNEVGPTLALNTYPSSAAEREL